MQQFSKAQSIILHLYPGIIITIAFVVLTPFIINIGFPPQLGILFSIVIAALPILIAYLLKAQKKEHKSSIIALNGLNQKLPTGKLILYSLGSVMFAYVIWGIAQPLDQVLTQQLFYWLPDWYTVQDFTGYDKNKILITLVFNLLLNGFLAPYVEELYFRGYLLPRMASWGKWAFVVNAVLFSLYHFWQPYIYLTLILSQTPLIYLVWRTKDFRLAVVTHSLLNIVGALLAFGLLMK
ncbi:MAG: CPBP family intramembrane metalloprotease [Flavisolibacter sp.]|nr:CPBP family intramembrane metalloprotease [Flavisolibacter sp.]